MSPEKQRIAIAESVGYEPSIEAGFPHRKVWRTVHRYVGPQFLIESDLPDYLSDLNAIHEVEKHLTTLQIGEYARLLQIVIRRTDEHNIPPVMWPTCFYLLHATAAQRAEAYLRTIGKWID